MEKFVSLGNDDLLWVNPFNGRIKEVMHATSIPNSLENEFEYENDCKMNDEKNASLVNVLQRCTLIRLTLVKRVFQGSMQSVRKLLDKFVRGGNRGGYAQNGGGGRGGNRGGYGQNRGGGRGGGGQRRNFEETYEFNIEEVKEKWPEIVETQIRKFPHLSFRETPLNFSRINSLSLRLGAEARENNFTDEFKKKPPETYISPFSFAKGDGNGQNIGNMLTDFLKRMNTQHMAYS